MIDNRFVRGADKLKRRLDTIVAGLALSGLTEGVGELLLRRTLKRFDSEVDPDGRPWVPLARSSLQRRKRNPGNSSGKILVQTRAMRNAIKLIRGGAGSVYTTTGVGHRIGIQDEGIAVRARVHNLGLGHVPQRRFLGVGRLDVKSVDSYLRRRALNIVDSL